MYESSPLGKIPYIETERGRCCESQTILEYVEAIAPEPPLYPRDPFAAAKVRELVAFIELHMELVARQLYGEVFFNRGPTAPAIREAASAQPLKSIPAFRKLARFSPYVAGAEFTAADCAAFVHLPLIGAATKAAYGTDYLLDNGVDWKAYIRLIGARPAAAKVQADRKAALERQGVN